MSSDSIDSRYLYSGGFAEIVSQPSFVTFSFFREWFTTKESVGAAFKRLSLPYEKSDLPLLEYQEGEIYTNLTHEQRTLYKNTLFEYLPQVDISDPPAQRFVFSKILDLFSLLGTVRIITLQSHWIINPKSTLIIASECVEEIPELVPGKSIIDIDREMRRQVWPAVIAVGIVSEFYSQYLAHELKVVEIQNYISRKVASRDWFFHSITDQNKVKQDAISFNEFMVRYGFRSDKDYELTSPRWWEVPETIKTRIIQSEPAKPNHIDEALYDSLHLRTQNIVDTIIELQVLRSEAKRKSLPFLNELRSLINAQYDNKHSIASLSRDDVFHNRAVSTDKTALPSKSVRTLSSTTHSGVGMGVSIGEASGKALYIDSIDTQIPSGTIGIFPNSSPEYSIQFPKCAGMIFLRGGQTSHGAIVSREFGIPALIHHDAISIQDGTRIHINGSLGSWEVVES